MNEIVFLIEDDPEGGYHARSLHSDVSIFTEADTTKEMKGNIIDALQCHFDNQDEIPKIIRLHYVKDEVINYAPVS
jgi:hypothetical protein